MSKRYVISLDVIENDNFKAKQSVMMIGQTIEEALSHLPLKVAEIVKMEQELIHRESENKVRLIRDDDVPF